jgi:Spy/CpxP family protein refolding chaperone
MRQTLLATILLGLLVLPLGAQNVSETPHGRELPFNWSLNPDIAREVGITDSQIKQIGSVFEVNRRTVQELRDEVGKREAELQAALDAGTVDLAQAEKALDAVLESRNRLAKTQTMIMIQMRLILSNDQWHKMSDLQRKSQQAQAASSYTVTPTSDGTRIGANEATAVAVLRTLNTAEITFVHSYNKGFTDGLNRLGTPASGHYDENHADMVDPTLSGVANGGTNFSFTKNGYRFTYTPGGGGFGNITTYTVTGQPMEYGVTGKRSFYTDNMAVIHETSDNRAATANDPSLSGR